jgi:hypothetical protein
MGAMDADYFFGMQNFLYFFIAYNFVVSFMTLANFRKTFLYYKLGLKQMGLGQRFAMASGLLQWKKCGDGLLQDNILSRCTASCAVVSNVKDTLNQWILLSYRLTSVL